MGLMSMLGFLVFSIWTFILIVSRSSLYVERREYEPTFHPIITSQDYPEPVVTGIVLESPI
jgi:hypothetical protein